MSQVLLIENNLDLSKVIKLNLMKTYEFEVVEKESAKDGIDLIEILPNIDLIIIREAPGINLIEFTTFLLNSKSTLPVLVIGSSKSGYKNETVIEANNSWKILIEVAGKILRKLPIADANKTETSYIPIPVTYFLNITETSLGCDVFIRVKKAENEFQYIKRLNSTDNFNREDIERYQNSGLKDFYISSNHFPQFVNYVTDKLTIQLTDTNLKSDAKMQLSAEVFDVTVDRLNSLGVDDRTVDIVTENLKVMQGSVGDKNALSDYLKLLKQNKLSYAYAHAYLTCLLLNKILSSFEWESASVREKITYICYFHDISLKTDILTRIGSKEELELADLSSADKAIAMNHANKSAEIVDQFPHVPMGVAELIRQHHGVKSGVGYRESLSFGISPVCMMFMVVEEFTSEFLKIPGAPNKDQLIEIFDKLELVFTKNAYAQTVVALKSSILNK